MFCIVHELINEAYITILNNDLQSKSPKIEPNLIVEAIDYNEDIKHFVSDILLFNNNNIKMPLKSQNEIGNFTYLHN